MPGTTAVSVDAATLAVTAVTWLIVVALLLGSCACA